MDELTAHELEALKWASHATGSARSPVIRVSMKQIRQLRDQTGL
jgi:hypothetical protein